MSYADERLELFARLRKQAQSARAIPDLLRPDPERLRFRLGTSLADTKIPFHLGAELREALGRAAEDLFFLVSVRHRQAIPVEEFDRLLLLDRFEPSAVRPVAWQPPPQVRRETTKRAFYEAFELHHGLDAGLVASWLAEGRPGRALAGTLTRLFTRAREDTGASELREPLAYLVLLAVRTAADDVLVRLKRIPLGETSARWLRGAVAAGLVALIRLALRESGVQNDATPMRAALETAADFTGWLGGKAVLASSGVTAYGPSFTTLPPRVEDLTARLVEGIDPEELARETARRLETDRDGSRRAERMVALHAVREELRVLLILGEGARASIPGSDTSVARLFTERDLLSQQLAQPDRRKELASGLRAGARTATLDNARKRYEFLEWAVREWREEDPAAWMDAKVARLRFGRAAAALACDGLFERGLAQAGAMLLERRGDESETGLDAEYGAGRLYFVGVGDRPLLAARRRPPPIGHLFADVKDFTRRTALLKEEIVADFLQREFYEPILVAAGRHHRGAEHLSDRGGIHLNNLLGDACSFSGDIVSLVQLARDIRTTLASYGRHLELEGSRERVARRAAEVDKRYQQRRRALESDAGLRGPRREHELRKLEDERDSELTLLSGEKLEAGIFLSFGSAPEVSTFDDPVFGKVRVAIAEKINESARGTARNGAVKAKVEDFVERARAGRRQPQLTCPWSVHVDRPLSIPIPAAAAADAQEALLRGDTVGAEAQLLLALQPAVRSAIAADAAGPRAGDIYNGGCALSEEALRAYVSARPDLHFRRAELTVASLAAELQVRFAFPQPRLDVVAGLDTSGRLAELFVYCGRCLFRGFEKQGGLGVWELLARDTPFFSLLGKHHLPELAAGGPP